MATTSSVPPTAIDRDGSRRGQSQSTPTRSQSARTRAPPAAAGPATASPGQPNQTHHRSSSSRHRAGDEATTQTDYEASTATDTSRRSLTRDNSAPARTESARSAPGHQRSGSRYTPNMPSHAANSGGPAPVVTPSESKHKSSGKSRTTIPAQTGNWVLGKTIGAGSMGKVKLARRAEGGEQVCT
jgi:hypothetical protein